VIGPVYWLVPSPVFPGFTRFRPVFELTSTRTGSWRCNGRQLQKKVKKSSLLLMPTTFAAVTLLEPGRRAIQSQLRGAHFLYFFRFLPGF
jgi:hypothetical protein